MSLNLAGLALDAICFPRVSGDEPRVQVIPAPLLLFSPRERG